MCDVDPLIGSVEQLDRDRIAAVRTLIQMNEPEHAKFRAVAGPYSAEDHAALDAHLDDLTGLVLRRLEEGDGECDFAADVAPEYALKVFMSIMGLPTRTIRCCCGSPTRCSPGGPRSSGSGRQVGGVHGDLQYSYQVAMERRRPRLGSGQLHRQWHDRRLPIPELEMVSYYGSLARPVPTRPPPRSSAGCTP